MEPTPKQQAVSFINRAQRILVVPGRPDADSIGSALALQLALRKLNKEVSITTLDPINAQLNFLPELNTIASTLTGSQDFVISLANADTEPESLNYTFENGTLNIIVTPKHGVYSSEQVSFSQGGYKYDLILTVDAADLTQLGVIYEQYPALFREVSVINIDHHATNSYFGAVNLVDMTATSAGEILVGLLEALNVEIDADIATCLLTGIISDTGSFQHSNTTPKSLTVAAQMVGFGGRQQDIIKSLFKTKDYSTLKLWGQVLANLEFDPTHRLVWATAGYRDIEAVGATAESFTGLIDELMTSVPGAEVVMLITEREPKIVSGSIRTSRGVSSTEIAELLGGGGHLGAAGFRLMDMTLTEAVPLILSKVRQYQIDRLGLNIAPPSPTPPAEIAPEAQNTLQEA
ncbi:MAG: DHH family phosphoesterase [Patescibacteria group bacterium]